MASKPETVGTSEAAAASAPVAKSVKQYDITLKNIMMWADQEIESIGSITALENADLQYSYALSTLNGMAHLKDALDQLIKDKDTVGASKRDLTIKLNKVIRVMKKLMKDYNLDIKAIKAFNVKKVLGSLEYLGAAANADADADADAAPANGAKGAKGVKGVKGAAGTPPAGAPTPNGAPPAGAPPAGAPPAGAPPAGAPPATLTPAAAAGLKRSEEAAKTAALRASEVTAARAAAPADPADRVNGVRGGKSRRFKSRKSKSKSHKSKGRKAKTTRKNRKNRK
jgi:hypothetical protein